jgi:hypothetical protein
MIKKYLPSPYQFDALMQDELLQLGNKFGNHFQMQKHYQGDWSAILF